MRPPKAFTASFFALDSEFISCHQHTIQNRPAGACVEHGQAILASNLALRALSAQRTQNHLVGAFLTTSSFSCSVFFTRQLVHIMYIGFPPKNSFWRAPELCTSNPGVTKQNGGRGALTVISASVSTRGVLTVISASVSMS